MDHVEIEFKILLDKTIYQKILDDYQNQKIDDYVQTNYYLFHPKLDQKKYSLRIRYKKGNYELTLKTPNRLGLNEYNENINEDIKNKIFDHQKVSNKIFDILEKDGIDYKELQCGHYLTTHRVDIPLTHGLLSLDANEYNGHHDYELEFEVDDCELGFKEFQNIIQVYHLEYKGNCLSKIRRMKATL